MIAKSEEQLELERIDPVGLAKVMIIFALVALKMTGWMILRMVGQ